MSNFPLKMIQRGDHWRIFDKVSEARHGKNTFWFRRHNFETIYGSSITVGEAVKSINFYMYHSSDKVVDVLKLGKMYIIKLQKVVFIVVFAILAKL